MIEQKISKEEFFDKDLHGVTTILGIVFGKEELSGIPITILNAAAERGHKVHEYIETFINTGEWPEIELAYQIYIDHFKKWYDEYKPTFISSEQRLMSDKLGYKGIIDTIFTYKDKKGKDIICMCDWKTSSNLNMFNTMCQLNLYVKLFKEFYDLKIDEIRTLSITKQGYRFSKFEINDKLCNEILHIYKLKKIYNGD